MPAQGATLLPGLDGEGGLYRADLSEIAQVGAIAARFVVRSAAGPLLGPQAHRCALLRCLQALPPRCYTGEDTATWLRDELLTLRLEGTAAADVAVAGEPALPPPTHTAQPQSLPSYTRLMRTSHCAFHPCNRAELAAALRAPHAVDRALARACSGGAAAARQPRRWSGPCLLVKCTVKPVDNVCDGLGMAVRYAEA